MIIVFYQVRIQRIISTHFNDILKEVKSLEDILTILGTVSKNFLCQGLDGGICCGNGLIVTDKKSEIKKCIQCRKTIMRKQRLKEKQIHLEQVRIQKRHRMAKFKKNMKRRYDRSLRRMMENQNQNTKVSYITKYFIF